MSSRNLPAFCCLLVPASLLAWFHHACFPAVVSGTRQLWGMHKPLPTGFEWLCRLGGLTYLPLALIVVMGVLSWRFPAWRGELSVAVCAGILAVICVLYALLVSTPALAHGLSI